MKDLTKSVAFTGHRSIEEIDQKKLEGLISLLLKKGYNRFLIGMAVGFDTMCFKALEKFKSKYDFTIVACIPCRDQDKFFTESQKLEYARMISVADERIVFSEKYNASCMHRRNCYMVDNCSVLISYLKKNYGGTFSTVKYAEKLGKKVINIA